MTVLLQKLLIDDRSFFMPSETQGKYWCFTLNNYTDEEEKAIEALVGGPEGLSYVIYGKEVGDSGTPHLQGYIEFNKRIGVGKVRKLFPRAHIELRIKSQEQASSYCKKDGNFTELGSKAESKQGLRTDLINLVEGFSRGGTLKEVALTQPDVYCRYRNGLRDMARWTQPPRTEPPIVYWIWGPPGSGKSRWAHAVDPASTWSYGGDGWFDGYEGQKVAIFDDFDDDIATLRQKGITYGLFLKLLDRYPLQVPVKGGFTNWRPETIIFTSNREFGALYLGYSGTDRGAIERRFTEVREMKLE